MVRLAVYGDIHGNLDAMFTHALGLQEEHGNIDAVLQVGDFETMRTGEDLSHYTGAARHARVTDIAEYCSGPKEAPFLTIFTGGNHEAWNVLAEHKDGGFVAPHIYFLGMSGVIDLNGVRIGGLTGVYNRRRYNDPLPQEADRTWQFYRRAAVDKLRAEKVDVLLMHDWFQPYSRINVQEEHGVTPKVRQDRSASPTLELVEKLSPRYVLMGHKTAYVRGTISNSQVLGLTGFKDGLDPHSFSVIEL